MQLSNPHQYTTALPASGESSESHLVVMGLNYHSTPLFIREKFVIPESCLKHALGALARMPHVKEAAVLSTCNRTEVYAVVSNLQSGLAEIESFFTSTQHVADHEAIKPDFKLLRDDVALHLFRVASGLDSLVLGEGQIMSQVKAAHRHALEAGTAGAVLDQLFKLALVCGKRVRSETSMSRRAVSVSSAAVELARELLGSLKNRSALIIGAGKMAQISAKHLLSEQGAGQMVMINRTSERLEHFLENKLNNKERLNIGFSFEDRHALAAASDLVIVATSAPAFVLTREAYCNFLSGRPTCIIDISVPRNVDPQIAELPNVRLFHADDLAQIVNKNLAEREALTSEANEMVFQSLEDFHAWERSILVAPTIAELRRKIEAIRTEHLVKSERCKQDDFEEMSRVLVNQILHHPTTQLKSTSDYQVLQQQADALRKLFKLDIFTPQSCAAAEERQSLELNKVGQ